jgi:hypothetical protein
VRDQIFEDRRRALEEAFFKKQNREVLERLQAEQQRQTAKQALREATNIQDDAILDRLLDFGFDASSLLAFGLVPAIEVAWADGEVDEAERKAILARLEKSILKSSAAYQMIEAWLARRPPIDIFETWVEYTRELCKSIAPADREWLRSRVVGSAHETADASGGLLGLMLRKSRAEKDVLRKIEDAFAG